MSNEKLRELSDRWLARADFLRGINGSKSDAILTCRGELNELLEALAQEELSPFQKQLKNFKNERRINLPVHEGQLLGAQKHLETCAACNHGRTLCSEYRRNYEDVEAHIQDEQFAHWLRRHIGELSVGQLAAKIATHRILRGIDWYCGSRAGE